MALMFSTSVFTSPLALTVVSILLLINNQLLFFIVLPAILINIKSVKAHANLNLLALPAVSIFYTIYTGRYVNSYDSTAGSDKLIFPLMNTIKLFTETVKLSNAESMLGMAKKFELKLSLKQNAV